ncbi:PAS domain S-box protein [Methanohalophilus sp. RSK]|uniref:PAS domain S-box protein n=1 Tax=Methanohalophilus sp. RSK TaxID=2485783 RepID=UPI000F43D0F6|nr:PAS domain S-box protein [Methanohalophilus sp. RSK]RNI15490.1 PAS domain S-box protein [Methanohalophilus sp. RSK]
MDDMIQSDLYHFYEIVEEGICFHEMIYDEEGIPEDYIITGLNPAYEKILGLSRENVIGKRASDIYGCKKPPYIDVYSQVAKTGRATRFETYFPPMNKYFTISVSSSQKGKFTTVFSDITDMKKAQKELEETKERFELAMDSANHGFWDWNLDTDETFFSPRYYTMLGYEPGELPMNVDTWVGLMHPEDKKSVLPRIQKFVENAQPYEEEFRLKCKDGTWKWISGKGNTFEVDKKGIPHRALGVHEDIDQRKKTEKKLTESENLYRAVVENSHDSVYIEQGNKFIFVNDTLCKNIGYTKEELYKIDLFELVHPDDRKNIQEIHQKRKQGKEVPRIYEAKVLTKDGSTLYCEFAVTSIEYEDEYANLANVRDVTQRKLMEEQLRDKLNQLQLINENIPNVIWKVDIDDNYEVRNAYISDAVDEFLNLPPKTINNDWQKYFNYIKPEYIPKIMDAFKLDSSKLETKMSLEYEVEKADGTNAWFLSSDRGFRRENGLFQVYGTTTDITNRKKMEIELNNQKDEKEMLLDTVDIQIWYLSDPDTYALVNDAHANFLGMEKEEIQYKKLTDFLPLNVANVCREGNLRVFTSGKQVDTIECVKDPTGEERLLSIKKVPKIGDNGEVDSVICTALDITKQTRLEHLMQLQMDIAFGMSATNDLEEALNLLLDEMTGIETVDSGGIYIVDEDTGGLDLIIQKGLSNKFVKESSYYEKDSPQVKLISKGKPIYKKYDELNLNTTRDKKYEGLTALAIVPIMVNKKLVAAMNLASHTHESIPDYSRNMIETTASMVGNIIENKKIHDRTKRQRRELINFYNNLNDLVFILDMNGNIITTNKMVELKLGYTSDELKSMYVLDVHPPERRDEAHTIVEAMVKGQKDSCHVPLIDCKGNEIPVETKITYGTWKGKNVIFGVSQDISEQKKFEDALIQAKTIADEANLSKSEFLANMSHELRTPLNSIIGFSQVLDGEQFGELNEKQHKYISNVESSGEYLLELINGVLDLSKIESGKMELEPELIDVPALIKEASIYVKQLAKEKNIHLEIDISPDSFEMCIDKIKLKEIIHNLLSNAIKYTPANGNVCLKGSIDDKKLKVSVIDEGIGISPELQETIFDPFIQAGSFSNKEYKGTGLGLALVKKYVEMHDGEIGVESAVGKGSTFTFNIPLK